MATFPALEYPRAVALPGDAHGRARCCGSRRRPTSTLPPGDGPLVLVAPSTSQDPSHRLLRATLRGLADAPVRVLAVWNGRPLGEPIDVPANARLVDWLSYARVMPRATSSSATAATGRSRGRWPAAARSSSSPPRAT